uniref:Uncharacterized protein n=1 Tax=Rhizophora mucronata TaxID=61149 RepID=A0A2P2N1W8_RHIMU
MGVAGWFNFIGPVPFFHLNRVLHVSSFARSTFDKQVEK